MQNAFTRDNSPQPYEDYFPVSHEFGFINLWKLRRGGQLSEDFEDTAANTNGDASVVLPVQTEDDTSRQAVQESNANQLFIQQLLARLS